MRQLVGLLQSKNWKPNLILKWKSHDLRNLWMRGLEIVIAQ